MKTKDELIDEVKQLYAEIADLRVKYQLLVVMRDFAGENMSHEFKNSSQTKVSRAISSHYTSHGKMVWVKQASSRCSYWQELRWLILA